MYDETTVREQITETATTGLVRQLRHATALTATATDPFVGGYLWGYVEAIARTLPQIHFPFDVEAAVHRTADRVFGERFGPSIAADGVRLSPFNPLGAGDREREGERAGKSDGSVYASVLGEGGHAPEGNALLSFLQNAA